MIENIRPVRISDMMVSNHPADVLVAYGLGSCVGVCLYDPVARVGGMLHALLPTMTAGHTEGMLTKFVDHGIPLLLTAMFDLGAMRYRLAAYLCGGASLLLGENFTDVLNIGERNVLMARSVLRAKGIPIKAEATGGSMGRTVRLYIATGLVTVKTMGRRELPLN
ncbi:MAG: chemotaxis protein CheD [Anaerolineae bacterium]|nr:chemotaxis protein CheD [Anaerolineae bacterium]